MAGILPPQAPQGSEGEEDLVLICAAGRCATNARNSAGKPLGKPFTLVIWNERDGWGGPFPDCEGCRKAKEGSSLEIAGGQMKAGAIKSCTARLYRPELNSNYSSTTGGSMITG